MLSLQMGSMHVCHRYHQIPLPRLHVTMASKSAPAYLPNQAIRANVELLIHEGAVPAGVAKHCPPSLTEQEGSSHQVLVLDVVPLSSRTTRQVSRFADLNCIAHSACRNVVKREIPPLFSRAQCNSATGGL